MIIARVIIAVLIGLFIYLVMAGLLKKFWIAPPAEPDPDSISDVEIRYSCIVCGAEVVMIQSPTNIEIEAPRHCREDMVEITGG